MDIFINNEKIEFKLENEKNLKDIVDQFKVYFESYRRHIDEIKVNGETISEDSTHQESIAIDTIQSIHFNIISVTELALSTIAGIKSYLLALIEKLKTPDYLVEHQKDFFEGMDYIVNGFQGSLFNLGLDTAIIYDESTSLEEVFAALLQLINQLILVKNDQEQFKKQIVNIKPAFDFIIKRCDDIPFFVNFKDGLLQDDEPLKKEALRLFDVKIALSLTMNNILVDLVSKNKMVLAMSKLQSIASFISYSLNIIRAVEQHRKEEGKYDPSESELDKQKSLYDILSNLYEAMKNEDVVSISDVIEYELPDQIRLLSDYMKELCMSTV